MNQAHVFILATQAGAKMLLGLAVRATL